MLMPSLGIDSASSVLSASVHFPIHSSAALCSGRISPHFAEEDTEAQRGEGPLGLVCGDSLWEGWVLLLGLFNCT